MVKIDTHKLWQQIPDLDGESIKLMGASIRKVEVGLQYFVSGNLKAAAAKAKVDDEGAGALGLVVGTRFSLRLARERMLIVSDRDTLSPGWDSEGYAVTAMHSALAVFEITGSNALEVVKRGAVISTGGPSRSAMVSFAGMNAALYYFCDSTTVRLHVDRGLSSHLWSWFTTLQGLGERAAAS